MFEFAVSAAVFSEVLFKSSTTGAKAETSFLEQQFWLYAYGFLISCTIHFISSPGLEEVLGDLAGKD